MPAGYIFWVLMILWFLFGSGFLAYPPEGPFRRPIVGGTLLLAFVLFALLGWKTFGSVVQ